MKNSYTKDAIKEAINQGYAWPGGYPLFFVTKDSGCLCTFADGNDLLFQGDDMAAFLSSCWPAGCEDAEDVEGVLDEYYHLAVEMVENK
jgi:hypothetical protein